MTSVSKKHFDFFRYIRIPRFLEMSAIGIDFSDEAVRFMELAKSGDQFTPLHFGERPLSPGVIVSGSVIKKDALITVLKDIRRKEKYRFVKASLPETKAYVFNCTIPKVDESEILDAVLFRLEENVPISAAEAVCDYTIIGTNDKGEIELSVTAIQEGVVREYIDIFSSAGFIVRSFELESRAIARALVPRGDARTFLVVHIGENRTVFSIVRNGVVRFTSTLHVGSAEMTGAITRNLSIPEGEAKRIKDKDTQSDKKEKVLDSVLSSLSAIKDEINKLVVYWFGHKAQSVPGIQKIDCVLLSGKDATIPGALEYVSKNVKVPVQIANAWENCFSYNDIIPTMGADDSLDYVTTIGLSLPKKIDA